MSILLTDRAAQFAQRTAIIASEGSFSYQDLLEASAKVASFLLQGSTDLSQRTVAFLAPPGWHYVALQWGIWRAGGIATPLSLFHPRPELEYVIEDTNPVAVIAHPDLVDPLKSIALEHGIRFGLST
jgi:malonyl-CoA/methylmalonyl-CoA synthetase